MRFGTWNVRSLYRSGSLSTVARELLARYKLHSVEVEDKGATVRAEDITFFMGNDRKITNWENNFL